MAPKGASTQISPIRLQSVARLKIRRPDKQEINPCLGPMSAMLSATYLSMLFLVCLLTRKKAAGPPQVTASKAAPSSSKHCESVWTRLYVKRILFASEIASCEAVSDGINNVLHRNLRRSRKVQSTITSPDYILKYRGQRKERAAWDDYWKMNTMLFACTGLIPVASVESCYTGYTERVG